MSNNPRSPLSSRMQEFCALYPTTDTHELASIFGVTSDTIRHWASQIGLKKDPQYVSNLARKRALGRTMTRETRMKITQVKRQKGTLPMGERHYKWKGGRPWERFKNPEYLAWRKAVLERDGYVCQNCGRQCKKRERGLAAHHIKPYADYPDLRYDVSNGITFCRQCHMSLHGKAPEPKEQIPCACGCGTMIDPVDPYGRPRRYVNHHSARGRAVAESTKQLLREQRTGKTLTPEHRAKIAATLQSSEKRIGRPPKSST
jgi:5-methylcytosine-specific restriction endonuclease McrA